MERAQVTLAFHVHVFHFPFNVVRVRHQGCVRVETHSVSEVVQSQVFHLHIVAISAETQLFGRRNVVKLPVVASGHGLEDIAQVVTVKVHQETH